MSVAKVFVYSLLVGAVVASLESEWVSKLPWTLATPRRAVADPELEGLAATASSSSSINTFRRCGQW